MHIKKIELKNFMSHEESALDIPDKGIVVVTGNNGAGKSSLIEAPAVALWGKTLRGTSPWPTGKIGSAILATDSLTAIRGRQKGERTVLEWHAAGELPNDATEYESTTKAQEALEKRVGSFDVWRRTHVFSSQDAGHFTLASDGERKRLLESILGLHRFDDALEACRADKKSAEAALHEVTSEHGALRARLEGEKLRVRDAERALATVPMAVDVKAMAADKDRLTGLLNAANEDILSLQKTFRELDRAGVSNDAAAREIERRLAALGTGDCDKCGQPIPKALRSGLEKKAAEERTAGEASKAKAKEQMEGLDAQLKELDEEREELRQRVFKLGVQIDQEKLHAKQRAQAEDTLRHVKESVVKIEERLAVLDKELSTRKAEVNTIISVESVLGLRGVRAHVLGKALTGLEEIANSWLGRIAGEGLRLEIKPYSEKKTGGVSDSISLEIIGAGGGLGYKASSGGERRRIDVAMLFALAEISSAAHGVAPGTLWVDECFDSLDPEGVKAVASALQEIASERAVVVITHREELVDSLQPVLCVRVADGTLTTR